MPDPSVAPAGNDVLKGPLRNAKHVRQRLGGCSTMTFYRLRKKPEHPDLPFPSPVCVINGLNYWTDPVIDAWLVAKAKRDPNIRPPPKTPSRGRSQK